MVKTYILAPNWTTAPPPDGPIKLGHLMDDLTKFELINRFEVVPTTPLLNPLDTKTGFSASRRKLILGELGFAAKVIGLVGVGAGAKLFYKKDKNDVLSVKKLITMTFDPTDKYIAESMSLASVQEFMRGSNYRAPVFMITGLKIARGGALQSSSTSEKGARLEGGLAPPGSPAELGGTAGVESTAQESESWEGSSPFIVAFRVRKIWYRRNDLKHVAHNERVVMQDGAVVRSGLTLELAVDDDVSSADVSGSMDLAVEKGFEDGGDGEEVQWIVPKMGSELAL